MRTALVLSLFALVSCDRLLHRSAPEAGVTTTPTPTATTTETMSAADTATTAAPTSSTFLGLHIDDEEPEAPPDAGPCPLDIHPYYCRRRCRTFFNRKASLHARRIAHPTRAGIGKCDKFDVFAEDDATGGIVEYYDDTGQLAGVTDSRQKPCGTYGKVPKCKLEITWQGPHGGGLGDLKK